MKALVGKVNDTQYINFVLTLTNENVKFTDQKEIIRTYSKFKGYFVATTGDEVYLNNEASLLFEDLTNKAEIRFIEVKTAPLVKISVNIPNPSKYVISEFYILGHFEILGVNIHNKGQAAGDKIMSHIESGKKIILANRCSIEKKGEPLLILDKVETSIGTFKTFSSSTGIDI